DVASICWSPGLRASCPDTKTSPPARIAWEYGSPWKGAGAFSVLMTILSDMRLFLSPARAARLRKCHSERLEDRLEHVVRVRAVDQPHVERQGGAVDELAQERRDEIDRHAAEPGTREVHVGHEQRLVARLERDVRERLGRRKDGGAVAARAFGAKRCGERLAERPSGCAHFRIGVAGSDLECEVEGRVLG